MTPMGTSSGGSDGGRRSLTGLPSGGPVRVMTRNCSNVRVFGPNPAGGGVASLLLPGEKSAGGVPAGNGTGASL